MLLYSVSDYHETLNSDHRGNPLITGFPSLDRDTIATLMTNTVSFDPREREHPSELRIQYVMRLLNFFLPLDGQVDFCMKLWALICHGYRRRNPLRRIQHDLFSILMRSIRDRTLAPSDDATAFDAMLCAILLGTPGTGKTSSVNAFLNRLGPGLLHHRVHGELYQLLHVTVQAPKNGSAKALAQQVFTSLIEGAKATGLPVPYGTGRMPRTLDELALAIIVLCEKLNVGILVLDELQHLYRGSHALDQDAMKFLTGVINRLGIPVLLIGTWECYGLLSLEARIARRATSPADAQYRRLQNDTEWRIFLDALFSHQFTRRPVDLTDRMSDLFYHHTQGIQDLAVKLLVVSQIEAILDESEELTPELVDRAAQRHLSLVATVVRMLREGRRDTDPTVWDLEPADLNQYVNDFAARASAASRRAVDRRTFNAARKVDLVDSVAASLIATGNVPTEHALSLAHSAVSQAPHKPAAGHVEAILHDLTALAPRPGKSRSAKRRQAVDSAIMAFDDEDVRKIVYAASREPSASNDTIATALASEGHLCSLLEDLAY